MNRLTYKQSTRLLSAPFWTIWFGVICKVKWFFIVMMDLFTCLILSVGLLTIEMKDTTSNGKLLSWNLQCDYLLPWLHLLDTSRLIFWRIKACRHVTTLFNLVMDPIVWILWDCMQSEIFLIKVNQILSSREIVKPERNWLLSNFDGQKPKFWSEEVLNLCEKLPTISY